MAGRSAAAALLVVAGCTYSEQEPGLLERETPQPSVGPPSSTSPPTATPLPVTNPELPVAGESVWTSADGLDVQVRFAVHAVRRVDGGTVLDWSVTPIRAANLRPGDPVPDSVDLGLSRRWESSANVLLVDAPGQTVYRPLVRGPDSDYCLCTPIWVSQRSLRIGVTTLLQVAFPELPDALRTVDVDIPTVPQFSRVPVTPVGQVPVAGRPTDLTRPAEVRPRVARSEMFRYGPSEQVFRVRVDRVIAGAAFTSLEWAIVSVTGGDGVEAASDPPFASADAATVTGYNRVAASGPVLRVAGDGASLRTRVMTNRRRLGRGRRVPVYRPPGLGHGAPATGPGGHRGDELPGSARRHPAGRGGLQRARPGDGGGLAGRRCRRRFRASGPGEPPVLAATARTTREPGWKADEWPTPVPSRAQLERYTATVDQLVR